MCSLFLLKIWLYSSLLSIVLMWLYESKKWTVFTLGLFLTKVALGGPEFYESILFFKSLVPDTCFWLLWSRCSRFFSLDKNWTSESSCFQIFPHVTAILFEFLVVKFTFNTLLFRVWRWEIIWSLKVSGLIFFTCVFMHKLTLVGSIHIIKGVSKVYVDNGSIMVIEHVVVVSESSVSMVSNKYCIINVILLLSWFIYGLRSNFLCSDPNEFMYNCRWYWSEISIIYLPVRFFAYPVSLFNR